MNNNKLYYILNGGSDINIDAKCLKISNSAEFNKNYIIIGIVTIFFILIIILMAFIFHMEYQCNCADQKS